MIKFIVTLILIFYVDVHLASKCSRTIDLDQELSAWKTADAVVIAIPIEGHHVRKKLPEALEYSKTTYQIVDVLSGNIPITSPLEIHQYVHFCNELVELNKTYLMRINKRDGMYLTHYYGRIRLKSSGNNVAGPVIEVDGASEIEQQIIDVIRKTLLKRKPLPTADNGD